MNLIVKYLIIGIVLLGTCQTTLNAAIKISFQTGNFSDGTTWVGGSAPAPGDDIVIKSGHIVTLDASGKSIHDMTIEAGGTFDNGDFDLTIFKSGGNPTYKNDGTHNSSAGRLILYKFYYTRVRGTGVSNIDFNVQDYGIQVLYDCQLTINGNLQHHTNVTYAQMLFIWNTEGGTLTINGNIVPKPGKAISITNSIFDFEGTIYVGTITVNGNVDISTYDSWWVSAGGLDNHGIFHISGDLILGDIYCLVQNQPGAEFVIGGDLLGMNADESWFYNAGLLRLGGQVFPLANPGVLFAGDNDTVEYFGGSLQTIIVPFDGFGWDNGPYNNLIINNTSLEGLTLASDISVNGTLTLTSGHVHLQNNNLLFGASSSLSGNPSETAMVVATGSGLLKKEYSTAGAFTFPLGTGTHYVPVTIENIGSPDIFGVSVIEDVRTEGLNGITIPQINNCVNITWNITEQVPGGSNLSITAFWPEAAEGIDFMRTQAGLGHYKSGAWDPQEETPATGSDPYSITRSGITSLSAFALGDVESPMAFSLDIRLDVYALLEGSFAESGMTTQLNTTGLIPLTQPYNTVPWYYWGTESVDSIPAGVVDWILLELRDAPSPGIAYPETTLARKAAFMLSDGQIVDIDGFSMPVFEETIINNLFVVVWHRYHINIMSANALVKTGNIYTYDFTNALGKAYLNGQKNIGSGKYGMYGGDGNSNGTIELSDLTGVWSLQAGKSGYLKGDFNMDGAASNPDKNDLWYGNIGVSSVVPN